MSIPEFRNGSGQVLEGTPVGTFTVERDSPLGEAFLELLESFQGFPWCQCSPGPKAESWVYFEGRPEYSHGWECPDCQGIVQAG